MKARASRNLDWIARRTGATYSANARAIEAVDAEGVTRGMVAYDGWAGNSVHIHIALERSHAWWALARPAFEYPFVEAGKGVLIALVSSRNTRSLRLTAGVGFREVARLRDAVAIGVDTVIFEMRREDCRWLKE